MNKEQAKVFDSWVEDNPIIWITVKKTGLEDCLRLAFAHGWNEGMKEVMEKIGL